MFRQIPVQNKICFMKEHERNTLMHETKLRSMKKMIDNSIPPQYGFLTNKKKKEALQYERNSEIARENTIIFTKIKAILKGNNNHSHSLSRLTTTSQQQSNQAHVSGFSQAQGSTVVQQDGQNKSSLNNNFRKKEVVKVVIENQALMKRIQGSRSQYSVRNWEKERSQNEQYISMISEYQYKDFKPNKTFMKIGLSKEDSDIRHQSPLNKKPSGKLQPLFKNKNTSHILFKNGKKIGSYIYLVEVKVYKGIFSINLENLEKQSNRYNIEIPEEEGMEIYQNECNSDPEALLSRIRIDERSKSFFFDRGLHRYRQQLHLEQNYGKLDRTGQIKMHGDEKDHHIKGNQSRVIEENEEDQSIHVQKLEKDQQINQSIGQKNTQTSSKKIDNSQEIQQQSQINEIEVETKQKEEHLEDQKNQENEQQMEGKKEDNDEHKYEEKLESDEKEKKKDGQVVGELQKESKDEDGVDNQEDKNIQVHLNQEQIGNTEKQKIEENNEKNENQ